MSDSFISQLRSVFSVVLIINGTLVASVKDKEIRVIVTGESHGMVEGCECVVEPGGGLARRSFMIKSLGNRADLLLLDAGGFVAGEMYDSYTEGRESDSVRSVAMVKGMGALGYDAVVVGDDDLQYGGKWLVDQAAVSGVPLVSANVITKKGKSLVKPYVLIKKDDVIYGITGLTSDEKMIHVDDDIDIRSPFASLDTIWKQLLKKSDVQIIVSHLGHEMTDSLVARYPECDLIVNGHRKINKEPLTLLRNKPVMQFGFQGKSLSHAVFSVNASNLQLQTSNWIQVHQNLPEDSLIVRAINYVRPPRRDVYDLYIMSQCPYGIEALADFLMFSNSFDKIQYNVRFIGSVDKNGEISSLHGEPEVYDEMVWLAVKELYPEKWIEFLTIRSKMPVPSQGIPSILKIDSKKIDQWISSYGKDVLTGHYIRSMRLTINASPTLLKNNSPFEYPISKKYLARETCSQSGYISPYCDSLPVCIADNDCKKKGMMGRCIADTCEFIDAIKFPFTVLVNDSLSGHPEETIIATTEDLFPGAEILKISIFSEEGVKLLKKWNYPPLPFYVFGKDVSYTHNFSSIESGVASFQDGFIFKPGILNHNFFPARKEIPGDTTIIIDPFVNGIQTILARIFNDSSSHRWNIRPVILSAPEDVLPGTLEQFRQDEAFRWLLINQKFKSNIGLYLRKYIQNFGNSFWNTNAVQAGIPVDSITNVSHEVRKQLLEENYLFVKELELRDPIGVLVNNKKLVVLRNEKELHEFMNREDTR